MTSFVLLFLDCLHPKWFEYNAFQSGNENAVNQGHQETGTEFPGAQNVLCTRGICSVVEFGLFGLGAT